MAALSDFEVVTPRTLAEALDALASIENIRPIAGGTDLMVLLESGNLPPCTFLNLQDLPELQPSIDIAGGFTVMPALTTYRDARLGELKSRFPMLAVAAREVGALAIQSRGTWAGNVANASPAADGVPALMAYDAELELRSIRGLRRVALSQFYAGYKRMDLQPDELITAIRLPAAQSGWLEYFRKVGARRFQAISKTLLAGRIRLSVDRRVEDIRLIFASVAPFILRAFQTENVVRGNHLTERVLNDAMAAIQDEIHPIDDIRSTEAYRRQVTSNLLKEFLLQASAGSEVR